MFSIVAIALMATVIARAHMLDLPLYADHTVWQVELFFTALLGILAENTQRHKAVLLVFTLWWAWVSVSDVWIDYLNPVVFTYETIIFSFMVAWALVRPYTIPTQERDPSRVAIAFYHGDKAPFMSALSALLGLPFSSIAVLAGNTAIRPHKCGELIITNASVYDNNERYTIINLPTIADDNLFDIISKSAGKPVKYGFLRMGCVMALRDVLEASGVRTKSPLHYIPSLFFYQVLSQIK